jgi:predicted tellurium resistance membrane protein TerC
VELLELFTRPEAWIALITLTSLEIVLGIDNIVFITIMVGKLPAHQRDKARLLGLGAAMGMRIALLFSIAFIIGLTQPAFTILDHEVSWRDIILVVGGLFLIAKATFEIHERLEGTDSAHKPSAVVAASFGAVIVQIMILDIIFSLDSVITAIGMADDIPVMVAAIVIAVGVMLLSAKTIGEFVERHPTLKMLALAFLLLIGTALVAEGFEVAIPKGYIYFAMGFSVFVEFLNLRTRGRQPVALRDAYVKDRPPDAPPGPA